MPTTTGCLTNYAEAKILDNILNDTQWTLPTCYLALWAGSPTDTGAGGAEVTTPTTNGYDRIPVDTGGSCKFAAAASRATQTNVDVTFGPSTGGPWSGVTHWALMDHVTASTNMIAYGDITDGTVGTGDSYKIPSGEIDLVFTAGSKWTDAVLNKVLDHLTGRATYTKETPFIALYEGDPLGAGAESHTPASNGYNRQDLDAAMSPASGGSITNGVAITFGPASGAAWGVADYFAVMSASTAGSVLGGAALTASKTINDGDSAEFAISALTFTLD